MKNKDVYDILKSLDEEPEQNSHEGFNRSIYKLIFNDIQIIFKRIFIMKRKKKKKKMLIYIKQRGKKRQKMILITMKTIGKMIKMIHLIIKPNLIKIRKRKKNQQKNMINLQI